MPKKVTVTKVSENERETVFDLDEEISPQVVPIKNVHQVFGTLKGGGAEQTFVKTFFFNNEEIVDITDNMTDVIWSWLAETNPEIISSSQSMTVKDGKYLLNLTLFYKLKKKE